MTPIVRKTVRFLYPIPDKTTWKQLTSFTAAHAQCSYNINYNYIIIITALSIYCCKMSIQL